MAYINPATMTKEAWLAEHGSCIWHDDFMDFNFAEEESRGYWAVVLVDNGAFTAAGVCNSQQELMHWQDTDLHDDRRRKYFRVAIETCRLVMTR